MIRLVTFDLDDTLWDLSGVIERAVAATDSWLACRVPAFSQVPRAQVAALHQAALQANPALAHDVSALRLAVLRSTLDYCGEAPAQAARLAEGALAEFLDWRHRVTFFPDALTVLAALGQRYTLAALTNGNADYARLGLDRYFAFGYCAADVGASKPDPAMFKCALTHAGVAAAEAVHVGDHAIHDVQGAQAAGMAAVWLDRQRSGEAAGATATATSLADLPATLAALDDS